MKRGGGWTRGPLFMVCVAVFELLADGRTGGWGPGVQAVLRRGAGGYRWLQVATGDYRRAAGRRAMGEGGS